MRKIILIRHGQASLEKTNYDQLSEKGLKQADILGRYLKAKDVIPQQIISGDLQRHQQTANQIKNALDKATITIDKRWNEFDFKSLLKAYLKLLPSEHPAPGDTRAFFSLLKKAMLAWSRQEIDTKPYQLESWSEFSSRIKEAIEDLTVGNDSNEKTIFVVSSGGAISMLLSQILEVSPKTLIELNFQIRNTSFTEIIARSNKLSLSAFNQINHLMEQVQPELITYV